jgi:hypothetical protein
LDEDAKEQCLCVFFKYLKSNRTKLWGKVAAIRKPDHPGKGNIYVEDEAFCGDKNVSSDEETEETDKAEQTSIDDWLEIQSFNEPYDPVHRLISTNFSSEVTETPANVGPTTHSRGKQLYSQSRGKAFCPPIPTAARGGIKLLRLPSGDSDSDSSSEEAKGSCKNPFRDILISDGLCDSDSWEDMAKRIEACKKKFDWKDEFALSNSSKEGGKFPTFPPDSIIPPVGFLYGSPQ